MERFKPKIPILNVQRQVVHRKNETKVQNNKGVENIHNSLNLELFFTYNRKRNLREVVREREKTPLYHYFHL